MSTVAAEPRHRTPRRLRVALLAVVALIALCTVAQGTVTLLDLAVRHTTTETQRFSGVDSLLIEDASDVRLTSAPAGAPLELRTKVTEGLRTPSHDAREAGGTLRLSSSCGWVIGNSCAVHYELRVPAGARLDVRGGAGDVHAEGLRSAHPVTIRVASGDVHVEGVRAPALRVHASSGDIDASGVRADAVTAGAASGDVHVALAGPARSVDVVASSGDIHVEVPDVRYRVDTDSGSGDVDDRAIRTSPDAARTLSATTGSGDIHLEPR